MKETPQKAHDLLTERLNHANLDTYSIACLFLFLLGFVVWVLVA